jgi:hypothetical protein
VAGLHLGAVDDPPPVQRAVDKPILADDVVLLLGQVALVEELPREVAVAREDGEGKR